MSGPSKINGWTYPKLSEIASEVVERACSGSNDPVFSVTKHQGFVPSSEYFKKRIFSRDIEGYKRVRRNQFAYATIHLDEGSIGQLEKNYSVIISPMYVVFEADNSRVLPAYLIRLMKSPVLMAQYQNIGRGSVHRRKSIHFKDLGKLTIPLPPLPEQRRIAAILDKADVIRRKRREAIRLAEEFLQSVFLDMFGDPVTNPKGWEKKLMETVVSETQYGTSEKANVNGVGLPILRMNNITYTGRLDLTDIKWCEIDSSDRKKYIVNCGDLLFNRTNSQELVGKTAVWDLDREFAFAGYLIRVRFKSSAADPNYIAGFLNSVYGKKWLFKKAQPSNNMSNISASAFRRIPVLLPPLELQLRYGSIVTSIKKSLLSKLEAIRQPCDELFSSLVQRAFRGELTA